MLLSVFGFAQHGQDNINRQNRTRLRLMQQITVLLQKQVTTIQLLFNKLGINMCQVTQDGLNYGFGGYKTKKHLSIW
jgi:hypothetical protein